MNDAVEKNIEPKFFVVLKHRLLRSPVLPKHLGDIHIIEFINKGIEDPESDPIALYYAGGTRKFLWRDMLYCEYNVNASDIFKVGIFNTGPTPLSPTLTKPDDELSGMLRRYSRKPFVDFESLGINDSRATETESIVRVLYKLKTQRI